MRGICETHQVLLLPTSAAYSLTAILGMASASSQDSSTLGVAAELLVIATICLTVGALAFSGLWRWWARWKPPVVSIYYFPYLPLGIWWIGVGLVVMAAGLFVPPAIEMAVIYLGVAISFFGLIGFVFMPRALLPRWYRAAKGLDRRAPDAPGGAAASSGSSSGQTAVVQADKVAPSPRGTQDEVPVDEAMRKAFGSAE